MCGFSGVISWNERARVTPTQLSQMSARIAHRGPDGEGQYISSAAEITPTSPQVALAHRRLAILDPDPRANQPFTDHEGRWLVFNGEIYNFRELRAELSTLRPAYEWRTNGDTEVLLAAYAEWGEKCVDRLNGMFAFAIWDGAKQRLFLARDRMGQKPLYVAFLPLRCDKSETLHLTAEILDYQRENKPEIAEFLDQRKYDAVAFVSELPALCGVPWVDTTIDSISLVEYLRWGYVPHPRTIYAGVTQLPPGTTCTVAHKPGDSHMEVYFHPSSGAESIRPRVAVPSENPPQRTRELVRQAVSRQLVSDVPLGCFLSGGIDSSIIAACMRSASPHGSPPLSFSIGFEDPRYDESEYAAAVAKHLGTRHHRFTVRPDAAEDLPKLAAVFGEPFGDSSALPTHYLARETRAHVKVALSGDGGDELFGGYDRYRAMLLGRRLRMVTTPLPWIALAAIVRRFPSGHPKSKLARAQRFATSLGQPSGQRYAEYMRLFPQTLLRDLLVAPIPSLAFPMIENCWGGDSVVTSAMQVDRLYYLPDDLLTKVDRASMLHALEVRSPFMDHELVHFAAGLTTSQLIGGGPKRMLREAFAEDLPEWVFKRKKMGFAVPIGQWFREGLREMLHDHLFAADSFCSTHFNRPVVERLVREHETGRNDHSQRLYALLMLELWWRGQKEIR